MLLKHVERFLKLQRITELVTPPSAFTWSYNLIYTVFAVSINFMHLLMPAAQIENSAISHLNSLKFANFTIRL